MDGYGRVRLQLLFVMLMVVEMTILAEERRVVERPWHLGDIPFQHVSNISKAPPMVLPP